MALIQQNLDARYLSARRHQSFLTISATWGPIGGPQLITRQKQNRLIQWNPVATLWYTNTALCVCLLPLRRTWSSSSTVVQANFGIECKPVLWSSAWKTLDCLKWSIIGPSPNQNQLPVRRNQCQVDAKVASESFLRRFDSGSDVYLHLPCSPPFFYQCPAMRVSKCLESSFGR